MKKIILSIVSQQSIPNLAPLLHSALKPDRAVFLVTPEMHYPYYWLSQVLQKYQIETQSIDIKNAWDISATRNTVADWLTTQETNDEVILNATIGTKPMILGAYDAFKEAGKSIIYLHPKQDKIIWLSPQNQTPCTIHNNLALDDYLQSFGIHISDRQIPEYNATRQEIAKWLCTQGTSNGHGWLISNLNAVSSRCPPGIPTKLKDDERKKRPLMKMLKTLHQWKILDLQNDTILFENTSNLNFSKGGWLEEHVYFTLTNMSSEFPMDDLCINLKIHRNIKDTEIPNELDAAFIVDNRLHIIECKTGNESHQKNMYLNTINQLENIRKITGGNESSAMFVSLHKITDIAKKRADEIGIFVASGEDLASLDDCLGKWLKRKQ